MNISSFIPRPVRRFILFLIIFIFVNICIFLTSPSSPSQVRSRFARREAESQIVQGADDGQTDVETSRDSFDSFIDSG